MADLSKAIIIGHVGKKNHRNVKNGTMTTLSVATNRKWKQADGTEKESVSWHTVNCFGPLAEVANKYTEVGDKIFVEGRINNEKIAGEDGEKWMYSITADNIVFLSPKKESHAVAPEAIVPGAAALGEEDVPF